MHTDKRLKRRRHDQLFLTFGLLDPARCLTMSKASDALAQPLTLPCGAVLPNRLCKAAMTEGLADELNRVRRRGARGSLPFSLRRRGGRAGRPVGRR